MSGLFGGKSVNVSAPKLSSLRLQTSAFGRPIPWAFGQNRVAPNTIDYIDFEAHAHKEQSRGGKGGGGYTNTTYTYTVATLMAMCSGPIESVGRVWAGKDIKTAGELGFDVYLGTNTQTPYPYMITRHPERALGYRGLAYLAAGSYDLKASNVMPNHSVEVQSTIHLAGLPDANIKDVIRTLLTDKEQGIGIDPASIDAMTQFSNFCLANQIWVSPIYTEQAAAYDHIRNLLKIGFADCVYSGGIFKVIPYSDLFATSIYGSYTPDIAPIYALTEDDFLIDGDEDAVKLERKSQTTAYNHVQITYADRSNNYNDAVVDAKDQGDIDNFGLRTMPVVDLKEICTSDVAQKAADFLLHRSLNIRNEYTFKLPVKYMLLEPMDLVTLTYPRHGLDNLPVMIVSVERVGSDLVFLAEDYPLGTNNSTLKPPATLNGYVPDFSADPGNSTIPVFFEPPLQLTGNNPEVWMATAGGVNWGGCEVHVSTDNNTYKMVGRLMEPSRYGALSSAINPGALVDTLNTLSVDISAARGELSSGTQQDALDLVTLCLVEDEYMAYQTATLTGVSRYNLTYLVRGAYATAITSHAAGASFVRVDDALFKYSYPKEWIGKTIWIKLVSFNIYGGGLQDISQVPAYQYLLVGAPLGAVENLHMSTDWTGRNVSIGWDLLDGADTYDVQVLAGTPLTVVRTASGIINNAFIYTYNDQVADGGPWRDVAYNVRGRSLTGRVGQWAQIVAHNTQVGALTGISVSGGVNTIFFTCATPPEEDFAGIVIWISLDPLAATIPDNVAYSGQDTFVAISKMPDGSDLVGGTTYYIRAAGYDVFGQEGLIASSSISVLVAALAPSADSITAEMIKDGALTATKFASGIAPIGLVSSLPGTSGYTGPLVVYNTADGKMYRLTGGAWTATLQATDINGQIQPTQLQADSITAGQIAAGAIGASEIAAGAITAEKLYIGSTGSALNTDPSMTDASAWTFTNTQLVTVADGTVGSGAARNVTTAAGEIFQTVKIPIDRTKRYRVRAWARSIGATNGTLYIGVQVLDAAGNNIPGNGTHWYNGAVNATVPTAWTLYTGLLNDASTLLFTASSHSMKPVARMNFGGTLGRMEIQDFRIEEVIPGTLIADGAISTQKIATGAITADKILANTITAVHIQANSITGEKIQAGSLDANILRSGPVSGNLLSESAFLGQYLDGAGRTQADGWSKGTDGTNVATNIMAVNLAGPDWNPYGVNVLTIHEQGNTGAGNSAYVYAINSVQIPIIGGKWYEFSAYTGAHRCRVKITLGFQDINGAWINFVNSDFNDEAAIGGNLLTGYQRNFGLTLAPINASRAFFIAYKYSTKPTYSDSWMFLARPYVGLATGQFQNAPSPWDAAGQGTQIHGGNIKTNTLQAGAIVAGTITATQIAANSITGDRIFANTITSDKINGNNLMIRDGNGNIILGAGVALNGVYIENATIATAHIGVAQIDTLRVGNGQITTSAAASGNGASGLGGTSLNFFSTGGTIVVSAVGGGQYDYTGSNSTGTCVLQLRIDGNVVAGSSGSSSINRITLPLLFHGQIGAGTHTYNLSFFANTQSGANTSDVNFWITELKR